VLLTVRANRALSPDFRLLELACVPGAAPPLPGQFVMVRTRETPDPAWRRPFGVHDFRQGRGVGTLSLLFQIVGPTTRELAAVGRGGSVDVLGPFGRGFDLSAREHWLVAGGRGVAPLYFMARVLRRRRLPVTVMIGGRSAGHVLRADDFARLGCSVVVATDDGSLGRRGLVTALLDGGLRRAAAARRAALLVSSCGPEPMLKAVAGLCAGHGVAAQVSVDPLMACGQGLCLGCTVHGKDGNRLACQHGPVFPTGELRW
jgi:dihydroorotate dehydrogenase electron transfer subunit